MQLYEEVVETAGRTRRYMREAQDDTGGKNRIILAKKIVWHWKRT